MNFLDERLPPRFWAKVQPCPMTGCWLWIGAQRDGYGAYKHHHRMAIAHRVTYSFDRGPVPAGLQLDHLCRVRCCVNPAHLEPVSSRENTLRGEGVAAQHHRATHCKSGHPFDAENTATIVKAGGLVRRKCRACRRRQSQESETRRRARRPSATAATSGR